MNIKLAYIILTLGTFHYKNEKKNKIKIKIKY